MNVISATAKSAGQPVFRFSITSWRTEPHHIDEPRNVLTALH